MNTLIEQVLEWSVEKGITGPNGTGTKIAQTCKFLEEVTETVIAVLKNDKAEIKDGIGDTQVTLILLCEMYGWRVEDIVGEEIFHETVSPVLSAEIQAALTSAGACEVLFSVVDKENQYLNAEIRSTMQRLVSLSSYYGWTLQECLQAAYDVISKRSGTMIEGSFVKSSDLDESPLPVLYNDSPDDPINFYPDLDDDMDEPLGPACQLGDETCESCQ